MTKLIHDLLLRNCVCISLIWLNVTEILFLSLLSIVIIVFFLIA